MLKIAISVALCLVLFSCTTRTGDVSSQKIFYEKNGLIEIEAESFESQMFTEKRRWYKTSERDLVKDLADKDQEPNATASGKDFIELLPDTRVAHSDKLIKGENFTEDAGTMAVLTYRVHFAKAGRYFIWGRAFSTGPEDNSAHFGLNNTWPESSQRLQFCKGKNAWTWSSQQRRPTNHCGDPLTLWIDVPTAGVHQLHVSMREDGVSLDKFILTQNEHFLPEPEASASTSAAPKMIENSKNTLLAIEKFSVVADAMPSKNDDQKMFYSDKANNALAINAANKNLRNVFISAAYRLEAAPKNPAKLSLVTLGETDGESVYRVSLNDKVIGEFTNKETNTDYLEQIFSVANLHLKMGDTIRVEAKAVTNGKIPEGTETAYSRGRWRAIVIE